MWKSIRRLFKIKNWTQRAHVNFAWQWVYFCNSPEWINHPNAMHSISLPILSYKKGGQARVQAACGPVLQIEYTSCTWWLGDSFDTFQGDITTAGITAAAVTDILIWAASVLVYNHPAGTVLAAVSDMKKTTKWVSWSQCRVAAYWQLYTRCGTVARADVLIRGWNSQLCA